MEFSLLLIFGIFSFQSAVSIPVPSKMKTIVDSEHIVFFDELNKHDYSEYTQEVLKELHTDKEFLKEVDKNQGAHSVEQYAEYLSSASVNARNKLDEIKRREINRLNKLEKELMMAKEENKKKLIKNQKDEIMNSSRSHLSSSNNSRFNEEDLKALIARVTHDIKMVDKAEESQYRRRRFRKQIRERIRLRKAKDSEEQKKIEQQFSESRKSRKSRPKVHEPGSEQQFKDVWSEQDNLDPQSYNSKTFFKLHDLNQDDHWDIAEVEALVQADVQKAYSPDDDDDEIQEKYHEIKRMRIHIMDKMDVNKDQLISISEFLNFEKSSEFKTDHEWKTEEEEDPEIYTEDDLENYTNELSNVLEEHVDSDNL